MRGRHYAGSYVCYDYQLVRSYFQPWSKTSRSLDNSPSQAPRSSLRERNRRKGNYLGINIYIDEICSYAVLHWNRRSPFFICRTLDTLPTQLLRACAVPNNKTSGLAWLAKNSLGKPSKYAATSRRCRR
jgi:hypothetical protein